MTAIPTKLFAVAVVAAAFLAITGSAAAGYPILPANGSTLTNGSPLFLVYIDDGETLGAAKVSTSPDTDRYGFTGGTLTSCYPSTPFNSEAHKYTCTPYAKLPDGTYYWIYTYWKQSCEDITLTGGYSYRSCGNKPFVAGPFQFTVSSPPKPTDIVGLPTAGGPSSSSRIDPVYSKIASAISKKDTTVQCWSKADWARLHSEWALYEPVRGGLTNTLGYVRTDESTVIELAPDVCARLDLLYYTGKRPTAPGQMRLIAQAIETLAHESIHVFGFLSTTYGSEAETYAECYALQFMQYTARSLGLLPAYSKQLQQASWRAYPGYGGTVYYSSECRDGGKYDLSPNSTVFP